MITGSLTFTAEVAADSEDKINELSTAIEKLVTSTFRSQGLLSIEETDSDLNEEDEDEEG